MNAFYSKVSRWISTPRLSWIDRVSVMNSTDDLAVRGPRELVFRHKDASLYRGTLSGFLEVSCGHQRCQRRKSEVLICLLSSVVFELLIS